MKKKRLISLFLMVIMTLAFTSGAFADVNMGSGDGTGWGDGTGDNVWSLLTESGTAIQAPEGLRITVYDAESGAKVFNTIDITGNPNIAAVPNIRYFADSTSGGTELIPKTSWLSSSYIGATYTNTSAVTKYNNAVSSRLKRQDYKNNCKYIAELANLTIISENNSANLEAIKTFIGKKEFIVHLCSLIPNLNYEDFAAGKYKIAFEPVAYFRYKGQNYALTATEVGIYNKFIMNNGVTTGTMKGVLGPLTHSNLPRSAFLEYKDLGVTVYSPTESDYWGDSRYNTDSCIIRCMGIGTVGMTENTEELPDGEDAAEYHTNTDVYTSFTFYNNGRDDYVKKTQATFSIYDSSGNLPIKRERDGDTIYVSASSAVKIFVDNPNYDPNANWGIRSKLYQVLGTRGNGARVTIGDVGAKIRYTVKTASGSTIASGTTEFSCPSNSEAMGWFEWRTPSRAQDVVITITPVSSDISLVDKDGEHCETMTINASISKVEERTPPDPKVTDTRPSWQKVYSSSSVAKNITGYAPKNDVTELSWYVWEPECDWTQEWYDETSSGWWLCGVDNSYYASQHAYENDRLTKSRSEGAVILIPTLVEKTYAVSLNAEMSIAPSQRCYTATYSSSTGLYTMKSGYGIEITMNSHISGDTALCTGAQIGNVLFPEFNYNRESSAKYNRLLEKVGNDLVFKTNVYSTYGDRVHFLPIWYPDNKYYTVYAEVFDVWCPAGQLSMRLTDRIIIKGNVYDDWHVGPTKP